MAPYEDCHYKARIKVGKGTEKIKLELTQKQQPGQGIQSIT